MAISPEELKTILKELAEMTWEQTPKGHYKLRINQSVEKPTEQFQKVFEKSDTNKQEAFVSKLVGIPYSDFVDLPEEEQKEKLEQGYTLVDQKLKELNINHVSLRSDAGANSLFMLTDNKNYQLELNVRWAIIGRAEPPRPKIPNILQAYKTLCFDSEGNSVSENEKNCMKIELLPTVPMIISVDKDDLIDKLPNRTDEEKEEIRQAIYKSYLANLPEGYLCNDPGQPYDLAILPDKTIINVDGGSVCDLTQLNDKKAKKMQDKLEPQNERYVQGSEIYQEVGAPTITSQKRIVPSEFHAELSLNTTTGDISDAKDEISVKPSCDTGIKPLNNLENKI